MSAIASSRAADNRLADREAVVEVIQAAAWLLNREEYGRWVELFAEVSEYEIVVENRDTARTQVVWWRSDRNELVRILGGVGEQFRDRAIRTHLVTPIKIEVTDDRASAVSSFALYRSPADEPSRLFLVGHYHDALVRHGHAWLYSSHRVVVDSFVIDTLTHVPL